MNFFAKTLKQLRIEKDLTQKELSQKLDVTEAAVALWEQQRREPSFNTLIKLSKVLDVSVGQLLGTEDLY